MQKNYKNNKNNAKDYAKNIINNAKNYVKDNNNNAKICQINNHAKIMLQIIMIMLQHYYYDYCYRNI